MARRQDGDRLPGTSRSRSNPCSDDAASPQDSDASAPRYPSASPSPASQRLDPLSAYSRSTESPAARAEYRRSYTEPTLSPDFRPSQDRQHVRFSQSGRDEGRYPTSRPVDTRQTRRDDDESAATGSPTMGTSSEGKPGEFTMPITPQHRKSKLRRTGESMKHTFAKNYQKYIIEGLLRQKPLPPSKDGRHIPLAPGNHPPEHLVDERTGKPYINNFIRSSRYTVWDFLPKQLVFQFSKIANFYFLVMGIMQMIPGLSTTGRYTTIGPLAVFVAFSMGKEGYDDYRRYTLDKAENRSDVWVLHNGRDARGKKAGRTSKTRPDKLKGQNSPLDSGNDLEMGQYSGLDSGNASPVEGDWKIIQWQEIRVGDVVRLQRDDSVPADMVLLHATGPNHVAYIDTMALDGETNLKSKQACPMLAERCSTMAGLKSCEAEVVSEDPNIDLYDYNGRLTVKGETLPLTLNNVVYRGSTVRNTTEAIGLVVNSGEECKIRMNAHRNVRAKAPAIQGLVNKIVLFLVFFVVMLSGGLTIGYFLWRDKVERLLWYLMGATLSFKRIFIALLLMFNTLIPLSLYISLEIIKLGQLYFLGDVEMYDPISNTPMIANTTTILENLGQVSYVFSDKTGTLTENMMRFRKMSVAGTAWLHDMDIKRDEAEKQRKIEMSRRNKKGKRKAKEAMPLVQAKGLEGSIPMDELETPTETEKQDEENGTSEPLSPSQARYPELKTETLLQYIRDRPNTTFSRKTKHFIMCMALCNTCLPEIKDDGEIDYQAASPDELALVEAARDLGYEMIDRPAQSIKLKHVDEAGSTVVETFEVLDVIEFTSKRKRMSIIIRMPDGRICVFCKGADSALLPRLKLSNLAIQKQREVERQASKRRSHEQESIIRRRSLHGTPRNSMALGRASSSGARPSWAGARPSADFKRLSIDVSDSFEIARSSWRSPGDAASPLSPKTDLAPSPRASLALSSPEAVDQLIDDSIALNEGTVFERCFQHTDDFATDGLRTLLFAYRYMEEEDYRAWKKIYHEATTSLVHRQDRVEAAGELIENRFDLAGASAIEDKLQEGVPDTIDKLRRANIKVWMLTGDKRETAINIGHSAKVCKPFSEIYVLDSDAEGSLLDTLTVTLTDVGRGMVPHSVVVIDGQTLANIDADEMLSAVFYELAVRVDSVICCRASPSQKAKLVKRIRKAVPHSMTLAIGDGANDIGMILASHVGIGLSGREGLQAARIADYSIAQFRFLQRLLFVHGRWNYIRTGKYILATFWKEIFFFTVQAHYQRLNGYTGTSLYENWSLTVFNGVFTSIPVIILGILDQDLKAGTLLRFPELYTFGQTNKGFNFWKYLAWSVMGVLEAAMMFYAVWAVYRMLPFDQDTSLYAMGSVGFTVGVIFINIKLLILEMHSKTIITFAGLFISICGWFLWNIVLGAIYPAHLAIYQVRDAFIHNFGATLNWWATGLLLLLTLISVELIQGAVRRVYFPGDWDIMQRVEKDEGMMRKMELDVGRERAEESPRLEEMEMVERDRSEIPTVALPAPRQSLGRRPRNSEEYAGGKYRPSMEPGRPSFGPVAEENLANSPPRDRQKLHKTDRRPT